LRTVARYKHDLETANVLCVVYVERASTATIAEFWNGVQQSFDGIENYFVLVFAGNEGTTFPSGVTVLPPPQFDLFDIDVWTHHVARLHGWSPELANAWTELLRDESIDGDVFDVRDLYEAMDRSIKEVRFGADAFRQRLEGRK